MGNYYYKEVAFVKYFLYKFFFTYPKVFSFLYYYTRKAWREEFEDRIKFCYKKNDPEEIKKIVKGIAEIKGTRKAQKYLIPHINKQFVEKFVSVKGIQYLNQAIKEQRGVVLMTAHIGSPHQSFCSLRAMGYNVIVVKGGKPLLKNHHKYKYFDTEDNTIFVHKSVPSETNKKRIYKILNSGGLIYYTADAGLGEKSIKAMFLGKKMNFPTGMVHLAHQANAVLIPLIHLYDSGRITLIFKEPVNNNREDDLCGYNNIIRKYIEILEEYIIKYPEQYIGIYGPNVLSLYYQSHNRK